MDQTVQGTNDQVLQGIERMQSGTLPVPPIYLGLPSNIFLPLNTTFREFLKAFPSMRDHLIMMFDDTVLTAAELFSHEEVWNQELANKPTRTEEVEEEEEAKEKEKEKMMETDNVSNVDTKDLKDPDSEESFIWDDANQKVLR